jgi:hypothetical protein
MPESLTTLEAQVEAELRPANNLERWLVREIAYASWELRRVRGNGDNVASEATLTAVYNRATRNWNRARKELQRLQTTRASQQLRLNVSQRSTAAAYPLADPARIALPDPARIIAESVDDMMNDIDSELAAIRAAQKGN